MDEAITIFDPNAPVPEAYAFAVDCIALGIAASVMLVTAVLLHRFLRSRLRTSAIEMASASFSTVV